MQTSGALCREIAKLYPTVIVRWQLNFVARMSEAKSGTTLAPSRMSLRSSGLRACQKLEASAPQRLQPLEGQALRVTDAGQPPGLFRRKQRNITSQSFNEQHF